MSGLKKGLLKIIRTEVFILSVSMNTFYAARGKGLAWIEVFAGTLTESY